MHTGSFRLELFKKCTEKKKKKSEEKSCKSLKSFKFSHMFGELGHVRVPLSPPLVRLVRRRRGGRSVGADGRRGHELAVRPSERRGPLPPRRGPIADGRRSRVVGGRGGGGGGGDGGGIHGDPVGDPLSDLRKRKRMRMRRREKP